MKSIAFSAFVCLFLILEMSAQVPPAQREIEMKEGDSSYVMKQYFFCLLKRGDKADSFTKEELEKIQAGHMAHINRLYKEGKIHIAGFR